MSILRRLFTSGSRMEQTSAKVQRLVDENAVITFTKSWCPHCRASRQLLDNLGVEYTNVELDKEADGSAIQDALEELTGQRTVPNNFINKKHIGGNSDLQDLHKKGKLDALLKEAAAATAQ